VPSTAWRSGTSKAGSLRPGSASSGAGIRVFSRPQSIFITSYRSPIGCLAILLALISPRLALFFVWLFSNLLSRAFDGWLVPLLGFFLLPWTTLAYALLWSSSNGVLGFEWFLVVLAFLFDIGAHNWGARERRRA
jgi:hypothetical protein